MPTFDGLHGADDVGVGHDGPGVQRLVFVERTQPFPWKKNKRCCYYGGENISEKIKTLLYWRREANVSTRLN